MGPESRGKGGSYPKLRHLKPILDVVTLCHKWPKEWPKITICGTKEREKTGSLSSRISG